MAGGSVCGGGVVGCRGGRVELQDIVGHAGDICVADLCERELGIECNVVLKLLATASFQSLKRVVIAQVEGIGNFVLHHCCSVIFPTCNPPSHAFGSHNRIAPVRVAPAKAWCSVI